jgi:hypothetical protein
LSFFFFVSCTLNAKSKKINSSLSLPTNQKPFLSQLSAYCPSLVLIKPTSRQKSQAPKSNQTRRPVPSFGPPSSFDPHTRSFPLLD